MNWQEIAVAGYENRSAIEHCAKTTGAHVELELPDNSQLPQAEAMYGMWFVELTITGFEPTAGNERVCFTGTITGTDIPVQIIFNGDAFDRFLVGLE